MSKVAAYVYRDLLSGKYGRTHIDELPDYIPPERRQDVEFVAAALLLRGFALVSVCNTDNAYREQRAMLALRRWRDGQQRRDASRKPRPGARKRPTAAKVRDFVATLPGYGKFGRLPRSEWPRGWKKAAAKHFGCSDTSIDNALNQDNGR
jgi:hypothetical protein